MSAIPAEILAWRKRTGADRWDEMWEAVLHMPPAPNRDHQDLEWNLEFYLRMHWARPYRARVYHQINVAATCSWPHNYCIPDLVLLLSAATAIELRAGHSGKLDIRVAGDEATQAALTED
jgi:hypothetical protein